MTMRTLCCTRWQRPLDKLTYEITRTRVARRDRDGPAAKAEPASNAEHTGTTSFDRLAALLTTLLVRDDLTQLFARGAALAPEDAISMALAEKTAATALDCWSRCEPRNA